MDQAEASRALKALEQENSERNRCWVTDAANWAAGELYNHSHRYKSDTQSEFFWAVNYLIKTAHTADLSRHAMESIRSTCQRHLSTQTEEMPSAKLKLLESYTEINLGYTPSPIAAAKWISTLETNPKIGQTPLARGMKDFFAKIGPKQLSQLKTLNLLAECMEKASAQPTVA